jgi:hypothetical protein
MTWRRIIGVGLAGIAVIVLLLWVLRAQLAAELTRAYFRQHGIVSSVEIEGLGLSGVSARFALGPADAPDFSAERIELRFDPLQLTPRVVEVRLVNPVIRARVAQDGAVSLPSLQSWIDSLRSAQGQSRFVSEDLAVALTGLRAFLMSPYGALELNGDVKLVRNLPVSVSLAIKPAAIAYGDTKIDLKSGRLLYDGKGGRVSAHVAGDLQKPGLHLDELSADLSATALRWTVAQGGFAVAAPSLRLTGSAHAIDAGVSANALSFDVAARDFRIARSGNGWNGRGDLSLTAAADFDPGKARALLAADRSLADAAVGNLKHLSLESGGHLEMQGDRIGFVLGEPALLKGAAGAVLQIPELKIESAGGTVSGALRAVLAGGRLPAATLRMTEFTFTNGTFEGAAGIGARLNYGAFRGIAIDGAGRITGQAGEWSFLPASCAKLAISAFRPGAENLASGIGGVICPAATTPMIAIGKGGLTFNALARDMAADIPFASVRLEHAGARLTFGAGPNAPLHGTVALTQAQMLDRAKTPRFHPLSGSGSIRLQRGLWQGKIAATDGKKTALGDVTFTHAMVDGKGSAHIAAPKIIFVPDKLQPETLSPLLVAFRRAEGTANFTGDINWVPGKIASNGHLSIASLDFLTPLGKAHTVKTELDFVSLLPPATKPGQALAISRIDWTLPFSGLDVRFGFTPTTIQVDKVTSGFAEGHAALGAFTVDIANPKRINGAADLTSISLSSLINASNLGSKVKLEGKVSGHVPFSAGPDGFKIVNGHVQADGPGRLSVDRSLWTQGGAAASANAVQDFAYQALENLSFDQLSADLNSIPGGRLQILFHIKGRSDPPKPQTAEVGLVDLINGSALQKPIPLPSGTPIDLTLDTSLNFDELLKSYSEAWSKTLQGQTD